MKNDKGKKMAQEMRKGKGAVKRKRHFSLFPAAAAAGDANLERRPEVEGRASYLYGP